MIDLKEYRNNARLHDLCSEYTKIWDSCKSHKQLMDMALSSKGVDYVCDSIAKGWGVSPDFICKALSNFINGKYISEQKGYNSKMYCEFSGDVVADTTILCIINSSVKIEIPANAICEVYVTGKCKIDAFGDGDVVFVCYGEKDDISIVSECKNWKRLNKKHRDKYED